MSYFSVSFYPMIAPPFRLSHSDTGSSASQLVNLAKKAISPSPTVAGDMLAESSRVVGVNKHKPRTTQKKNCHRMELALSKECGDAN
jgi:hypothetical protein